VQKVTLLPYGKGHIELTLPDGKDYQFIYPKKLTPGLSEEEIVLRALNTPVKSKTLRDLTKDVKKILIITNDNTRPMPSRITIPAMIRSFFYPQRYYDITILIATGLHRKMTSEEITEQFGEEICNKYNIINHDARDERQLVCLGEMSTGNELWLSKLVTENELIISEGFIEPHFFAGFSGGRKSILPGIAGAKTIMQNHNPLNIANYYSRGGNLEQNPIHMECTEAAIKARLGFILNVALDDNKRIIAAFAGDPVQAHIEGCKFVRDSMSVPVKMTDIVITTNNGYPLDRNLYQVVKGIDVASKVAKKGGVIIAVAKCSDGVGHAKFGELILGCSSVEELYQKMSKPPCEIDQWQVQILARAMIDHTIILVNSTIDEETARKMFFVPATDIQQAVDMALEIKGKDASISIMPEGPVMIPIPKE
jgi:nickel-dependent lactate racemase